MSDQTAVLSMLVVEGNGPSLLGRDWLQELKIDWSKVHRVSLLEQYVTLFAEKLGEIRGIKAKIHLKPKCISKLFQTPFSSICATSAKEWKKNSSDYKKQE